jgi:hypothetical protein
MSKKLVSAVFCLGLLALGPVTAYAQQAEVIVRQGDSIEWVAVTGAPPHKVRFNANGASSIDEINAILENFSPALKVGPNGERDSDPPKSSGTLLAAKVKDDAPPGKTFVFVCGIHTGAMLSFPFKVEAKVAGEPSRTHKIMGVPALHWHLHIDTTP